VMPTYSRHPVVMAQAAMSAQAASHGRVVLGIGPSHKVVIERMLGLEYEHPARHTGEYVEALKKAFHGTGHLSYHGDFFNIEAMLEVPGSSEIPVLVAALAPRMLRMAGTLADGTITYWANERAIGDHVVPSIATAAGEAGRPSPRVVAGIPVAVVRDVDAAKERAAKVFAGYNAIPAYQRIRSEGGDDDLPDLAIIGTEAQVTARIKSYAAAGATDLAAAVVGLDDDRDEAVQRTIELLASLVDEVA
jgi:5,10-methylenetetrahydromethanopterin reductase